MSEKKTYEVPAECINCGHVPKEKASGGAIICPLRYKIPKGTPVPMFLMHEDCPNCGCKGTLKRRL